MPTTVIPPGSSSFIEHLAEWEEKARWVRRETVQIHGMMSGIRLASALSCVEIFMTLYYGGVLRYRPDQPWWEERDRCILSKGHGVGSLYPILADVGFFAQDDPIWQKNIPDPSIPGFETVNGALGHGLGVACGMAKALKLQRRSERVVVVASDGELDEGAVWEAVMLASRHQLGNLMLIVDANHRTLLGDVTESIDLYPLEPRFRAFGWHAETVEGHALEELQVSMTRYRTKKIPTVIIAMTTKGKGLSFLEEDALCHVRTLTLEQRQAALVELGGARP